MRPRERPLQSPTTSYVSRGFADAALDVRHDDEEQDEEEEARRVVGRRARVPLHVAVQCGVEEDDGRRARERRGQKRAPPREMRERARGQNPRRAPVRDGKGRERRRRSASGARRRRPRAPWPRPRRRRPRDSGARLRMTTRARPYEHRRCPFLQRWTACVVLLKYIAKSGPTGKISTRSPYLGTDRNARRRRRPPSPGVRRDGA